MDDLNVRDLFAMLAMCGMVANKGANAGAVDYASMSYKIADAMMEVRQLKGENHGS